MAGENTIGPLEDAIPYASTAWASSNVDLRAESPDGRTPARVIHIVAGSGTLYVRTKKGTRPLPCGAGDEFRLQAYEITTDTTGITSLWVGW